MFKKSKSETFKVKGSELLKKFKELVHEGNVRKIVIKNNAGKILVQFPLSVGIVGAVLAPLLAVVGAIAALVTECTITIERD